MTDDIEDIDDSQDDNNEDVPTPLGELALQTVAMPADTNSDGDIFGGWLVSQMDLAGAVTATRLAKGRVATVAIDTMVFLRPVAVGSTVSCYTKVLEIGRSSMGINVEVWAQHPTDYETRKVTEGRFTFVAIDQNRRTRPVPRH
jgi:acyl-CoA thioesterase YciA